MADIGDDSAVLLTPPSSKPEIVIEENQATITNGMLRAAINTSTISFYDQKGFLLLQDVLTNSRPLREAVIVSSMLPLYDPDWK